jgi:oligoribonuclease NrnB/cAMP/cGMP phosphodiesterase (DHH superfamily)
MLNIQEFSKIDFKGKKVAIVSHNDLDGAGPIIITDHLFTEYKYFTVSNQAVDKMVKLVLFAPDFDEYDTIFITDVSITDGNLADSISKINRSGKKQVFLFDHHTTALWLNSFDWAVVTEEPGVSGTLLFYNYMKNYIDNNVLIGERDFLSALSTVISDWDTWTWTKNGNNDARELSVLYSKTGINYFLEKYRKSFHIFNATDRALLQDIANKEKFLIMPGILKTAAIIEVPFKYVDKEGTEIRITAKAKCVSVAEAPNDLAEQIYEDGVDFVIMFYSQGTVSCRSRVDDVHLGLWVQQLANGGGHARSAGFTLNKDTFWLYEKYLNARYK